MGILDRLRRSAQPPVEGPYECRACGRRFEEQWQVCPDCGGFSIERPEW